MDNMEKVTGVSKANYKDICNRAEEVKTVIRDTFSETGGKPSLGWLQKQFNMSKKALQRHVRNTLEALGQDPASVPTTSQLSRKKKVTEQATEEQPAEQAAIEESDETPDVEEAPAEQAEHEDTEEPIAN